MAPLTMLKQLAAIAIFATTACASFWTVTSSVEIATSTSTDIETGFGGYTDISTGTITRAIQASATPTISALSTTTSIDQYYDAEIVLVYYPQDAVAESQLVPHTSTDYDDVSIYSSTTYMMPVTYTAPTSCPTPFTFATTEQVAIPTFATDLVTATSETTSTYSRGLYNDIDVTKYLPAGAAPFATSTASHYTDWIEHCEKPYDIYSLPTSSPSSGNNDDDDDIEVCSRVSFGCTSFRTWVIIVATVIPSLFLLGLLESYFWFQRLMLGKGCWRLGTACWACITLWIICFTRKQGPRSTEDQKALREQWKTFPAGKRFKLWLQWGFRHRYPVELLGEYSPNTVGIVPRTKMVDGPGQRQDLEAQAPPAYTAADGPEQQHAT